jgi:hypothetical protein
MHDPFFKDAHLNLSMYVYGIRRERWANAVDGLKRTLKRVFSEKYVSKSHTMVSGCNESETGFGLLNLWTGWLQPELLYLVHTILCTHTHTHLYFVYLLYI